MAAWGAAVLLLLACQVPGMLLSLVLGYRYMTGPGASRGLCSALGQPSALPGVPVLPVSAARVRHPDKGCYAVIYPYPDVGYLMSTNPTRTPLERAVRHCPRAPETRKTETV